MLHVATVVGVLLLQVTRYYLYIYVLQGKYGKVVSTFMAPLTTKLTNFCKNCNSTNECIWREVRTRFVCITIKLTTHQAENYSEGRRGGQRAILQQNVVFFFVGNPIDCDSAIVPGREENMIYEGWKTKTSRLSLESKSTAFLHLQIWSKR